MAENFNWRDFGIGLAAGWATAYVVYQARHLLGEARGGLRQRVQQAQKYAAQGAEGRYIRELIREAEVSHLLGANVPLSQIAIEPRFVPPPTFAAPPVDDIRRDVFRIVPYLPDLPYLMQPYNVDAVTIDALSGGSGAYALIGLPGSGRTTALQIIALYALGIVNFDPPEDSVTARLRAEDAAADPIQRAEKLRHRLTVEERAFERLMKETNDPGLKDNRRGTDDLGLYQRLMPIYVHLADLRPSNFAPQADPAEPLVRALQKQIHPRTAKMLPRRLYKRIEAGQTLLLLDGFDALTPDHQVEIVDWIGAFLSEHGTNGLIITAPAVGYGPLLRAGLTPVMLRPWHDVDAKSAAESMAAAWPLIVGKGRRPQGKRPEPEQVAYAAQDVRSLGVSDITLKVRAALAGFDSADPVGNLQSYLETFKLPDALLQTAIQAAAHQQNYGEISAVTLAAPPQTVQTEAASIEERLSAAPARMTQEFRPAVDPDDPFAPVEGQADEIDAMFADEPAPTGKSAPKPPKAVAAAPSQDTKRLTGELQALFKRGLLIEVGSGEYMFRHSTLRSYLAALSLRDASDVVLVRAARQPAWEESLAYVAAMRPIDAAAEARMAMQPDVRQTPLTSTARWLAFSKTHPGWRANLLRQMGNLFVAPGQFPGTRERLAAALVGSRQPEAKTIFERALKSPDDLVRKLAALGCGALGSEDAVPTIASMLRDVDPDVQMSAVIALAAIGTDDATDYLAEAFLTGSEQVRQIAAETLAQLPEIGYDTLYEAAQHENMDLRRAAIFGLRRAKPAWALTEIFRAFVEDPQWYVRSAAQEAILDFQNFGAGQSLRRYPQLDSISWLREWVEASSTNPGEIVPADALRQMLTLPDPILQPVAAQAVAQLGMAGEIPILYQALRDPEPGVRDAAQRSLAEFETQMGEALPTPV